MIDAKPFRIDLPCPHCLKTDLQAVGELIGKDEIACRYCGKTIDLTDEQWQAGLNKFIEGLRQIQRFKP